MFKSMLLGAALALTGCAGQAKPLNICLQPSDRVVVMQGCDAVIQPTPELDPVKSAAQQAALGPAVVGWIGGDMSPDKVAAQGAITNNIFSRAPALIAAMGSHKNIGWVYAADEYGHCDAGDCLYEYLSRLLAIADAAHAVDKKVLISMLPATLAKFPDAPMPGINAIDGIAFVIYPSMMLSADFGTCTYNSNPLETLAYCAIQRVRRMGFTGKVGILWQGFGMDTDTHEVRMTYLTLQRRLIDNLAALGADAGMAWGCYLGAETLRREPYLVPLCGTQYEGLVTPSW